MTGPRPPASETDWPLPGSGARARHGCRRIALAAGAADPSRPRPGPGRARACRASGTGGRRGQPLSDSESDSELSHRDSELECRGQIIIRVAAAGIRGSENDLALPAWADHQCCPAAPERDLNLN